MTVAKQPSDATCTVASGQGTVGYGNVLSVYVGCTLNHPYTVGGTTSGLKIGALLLANNGTDYLSVDANGTFTFAAALTPGDAYNVSVVSQPPDAACAVAWGKGSIKSANVTSVMVTCVPTYIHNVGGTVSRLAAGQSLILQNNGADPLSLNSNGPFTFSAKIAWSGSYSVTVATQPAGQTCTVNYGYGEGVLGDITSVIVVCTTETVLWSFGSGVDGANPWGGLTQGPDGALYGITQNGGKFGQGSAYKITLDGQYTVLWDFGSGIDGSGPYGALILGNDGNFYNTTYAGGTNHSGPEGANGTGTVYRLTPAGVESVLWSFGGTAGDGQNPHAGLTLGADGLFYGTTANGGSAGYGSVFTITPAGQETVLWSFGTSAGDSQTPWAPLIQASDGNFYGTSKNGGPSGEGTVFRITANGEEAVLVGFDSLGGPFSPVAPLIEAADGYLYGTTYNGGPSGSGAVFRIDKSASAVTVFWGFGSSCPNDGEGPQAPVIVGKDGNFYGTASNGGAFDAGTVYKLTPAGVELTLWSFGSGTDGKNSQTPLLQAPDGNFYGVTVGGGANGYGTVFRLSP